MKIKDLLKKILPVAILLVVIAVGAIIFAVVTKDKKNPSLTKDNQDVTYFTFEDGKIKFTNAEAYKKAKSNYGISVLTELIDKDLLADEIAKVTEQDVIDEYLELIFSSDSLDEYLEDNEIEDADAQEELDDVIADFASTAFASYGVKLGADEVKAVKDGDSYKLTVTKDPDFYAYAKYLAARYNYAYAKLVAAYAEEYAEYVQYKADYAEYEEYVDKLADYKANVISEEPEEVECPTAPSMTLTETKFEDAWNEDNVDGYWAIVIPYESYSDAETALLQHGIVIKTVSTTEGSVTKSKAYWFHYGRTTDDDEEISSEQKDGYNIITDSDYYKDLAQAYIDDENKNTNTSANPDKYGAYVLTEDEIKQAIINLYNQYYGWTIKSTPVAADEVAKDTESIFYFTAAELTSQSLLTTVSGNKFNEFDETSTDFRDFYSEAISTSYPKIYWILGKVDKTQWEDATDEQQLAFMNPETESSKEMIAELLEAACTSTVVSNKLDELRVEKGLIIYDTDLEADYLESYTSTTYEETKKSSKTVVAKCNDVEYTADALLDAVTTRYASSLALQDYQYQWMFLCAKDADGNLFNKYIDYEAFLNGKALKKCVLDNEEAEDLWEEIAGKEGTITNIKNSFASGGYESYGYDADYGWTNFLRDFFSYYYGVEVTSNDELAAYLIYQQIVEDYNLYIADVKNIDWNTIETNYVSTLNNYINAIGYHLLICVKDEDDEIVDPSEWTQAQKDAAVELYGKVLSLAKDLDKEDVVTFISALNTAYTTYNKYPVNFADGSFITTNITNTKGTNKFNYEYTYKTDAQTYDADKFDLAKYNSLGLSITYEELTTEDGTMVEPFENAVRAMWNNCIEKNLDAIVDGTYEDEIEIHETMIETEYGYHLYVNTSYDLSSYISEESLVKLPTKDQIALYQYESNKSTEDGYMSVVDLVADYVEAKQLGDADALAKAKDAIVTKMADVSLQEKVTSDNVATFTESTLYDYTNFAALTEKSTLTDNKIDADDLTNNTLVQTQITTWFTDINTETTGSTYYQLQVVKAALAEAQAGKMSLTKGENNFAELLQLYVESYQSSLTYNKGNKDICESLLDALANEFELAAKFDATILASQKAYAQTLFNGLDADDKADLQEAYDKVNWN